MPPPVTGTSRIPNPLLKKSSVLSTPWPFQTLVNIAMDHIAAAVKEINELTTMPKTDGMTEEQIYDRFAKFVEFHGSADSKQALKDGKQVIVALRRPVNTRGNSGKGSYNDKMAVIWKEADGKKRGKAVDANTQPSAQYEAREKVKGKYQTIKDADGGKVRDAGSSKWAGNDVNGDKRLDAGMLATGTHQYTMASGNFLGGKHLKPVGTQKAYRDVNHDGVFDSKDTWKKKDGTETNVDEGNFAMYIHRGGEDNSWSAGCQTLSKAGAHVQFFDTLKSKQSEFYYVLVDVK